MSRIYGKGELSDELCVDYYMCIGPAAVTCWLAQETTLSLMTFNIHCGNDDDGSKAWEHRRETVANAMRAYGPDNLGRQENL